MAKHRTSMIWKISDEDFQKILDNSNTITEILTGFNLHPRAGNRLTFKKRLSEGKFDLSKFNSNHEKYMIEVRKNLTKNKKSIKDILIEGSNCDNRNLKKLLVKNNLLEYKCSSCKLVDSWNNFPLSLQLDHINGINNDNRIENLRFLCPNCHSQTETFSGRHRKKITKCIDCNKIISKKSKRCSSCAAKFREVNPYTKQIKKFEISKEELINLIKQYPMTKVGSILGVSDNAVRKRCKSLGIDYKNLKNTFKLG